MFKVNETVMYGRSGACTIKDIQKENFSGAEREYYILTPIYESHSTVYVPVDNAHTKLKKLLSKQEIADIISEAAKFDEQWIDDNKLRREKAGVTVKSSNYVQIIRLIKLYRAKKAEFEENHKKFFIVDDKVLQEAENLLFQEFSIVLDIEKNDFFALISGKKKIAE